MKTLRSIAGAAVLVGLCGLFTGAFAQGQDPNTLGLTNDAVTAEKVVTPATHYTGEEAGTNKVMAKSYADAPPMIPHDVTDYLPIGLRNECLGCHLNPSKAWTEKGVTIIPKTHFVDRDGKVVGGTFERKPAQRFYNCSMCHAPQSDAKMLVESVFKPDR